MLPGEKIFLIVIFAYPVGIFLLYLVFRLTGKGKHLFDACSFGMFHREEKKKQLQKKLEEQMKGQRPKKSFKVRRRFPDFSSKNIDIKQPKP
ncbi:MAG: hypothetical protein LBG59_05420 [Candidatus Peribacteria bacterium]|jgi:hypothetical protein|nr:hypothetical protein [Candidatus Peribacteria bacterium]